MKKKIIICLAILILVIIVLLLVFLLPKGNIGQEGKTNNETSINVTGKLEQMIKKLNNNYTIKYSGDFLNEDNKVINAIVEFTRFNENFAIKSDSLGLHFVCENGKLKSVSTRYKMIVVMPESAINTELYNPLDDFGQTFNKSYVEQIDDKEYEIEEYTYNNTTYKYYFLNDEIKIIKYNDLTIKVIRIQYGVNRELFNLPTNYKIIGK